MKILIARNADTANYGGAETYVVELCDQIVKHDHLVVVATALPRLRDRLKEHNIETIDSPWLSWQRWHGIYTPLVVLLYIPWLIRMSMWYRRAIKQHKPDVIHPMNRDDWLAATIAAKRTNTPVVWTDHADLKHEVKNVRGPKNLLGKLVLHYAKKAQAIMVVSQAEKAAIVHSVDDQLNTTLHVVYNGVSQQSFSPTMKAENTIVIGITARLRNQKGLRELIDAFLQLTAPSGKHLELWLIGDGPDESALRARTDDQRIKYLGFKADWLNYVAACDIFAFPSYTEGFSLSLIEAAMLSRPIVATNVGGNPEIIQHETTGLLIEPKDVDGLQTALQRLIDDQELAHNLGQHAHLVWREQFQFNEIVAKEILPLYQQLVRSD